MLSTAIVLYEVNSPSNTVELKVERLVSSPTLPLHGPFRLAAHPRISSRETCSLSMPLVLSSTQSDFLPNAANQQIGLSGPML